MGRGRRVAGSIWNVGAGEPSLLPVRNANSGLTNPHWFGGSNVK